MCSTLAHHYHYDLSALFQTYGVFIWRRASPPRRATPLWRDPTTLVIPLCIYMVRGVIPLRQDLAIGCPRSRLGGLKIFHINTTKRARHFGASALFNAYFNPQQKEVVIDIKMSCPLARASPPDELPSKLGMKTSPNKRASPPSKARRLHINTALGRHIYLIK